MVYLIHFDRPLHHARHYLGYCADGTLEVRLIRHRAGRGARLLAVLRELGIGWQVVRVFEGDRRLERRLKNHPTPDACARCAASAPRNCVRQPRSYERIRPSMRLMPALSGNTVPSSARSEILSCSWFQISRASY